MIAFNRFTRTSHPRQTLLLVSLVAVGRLRCPRCGNDKVFKIKASRVELGVQERKESEHQTGLHLSATRKRLPFSALSAQCSEYNYPLPVWFEVIHLICQSKKGMSALQVHGCSQRMAADRVQTLSTFVIAYEQCSTMISSVH